MSAIQDAHSVLETLGTKQSLTEAFESTRILWSNLESLLKKTGSGRVFVPIQVDAA